MYFNKRSLEKNIIFSILFVIMFYIQLYARCYSDNPMFTQFIGNFFRAFQYIIVIFILIFYLLQKRNISKKEIFAVGSSFIFTVIPIVNSSSKNISGVLSFLMLIAFFLSDNGIHYKTFNYSKKIWAIFSLIGIICFVSYLLKFPIPYIEHPYYFSAFENNELVRSYIDFKFCFLYKEREIIRLCGICNEPGFWGTISALFLCADNINLKKKENLIIFIAGCLTSSVAFFMLLILYLFLFSLKNIKFFILLMLGTIIFLSIVPNISTGNETVDIFLRRIQFSNGKLIGDNRSNSILDSLLKDTIKNHFIWGFGREYTSSKTTGFSTYKSYIIDYGVIGFILMYGSLFFSAIYMYWKKKLEILVYPLVFFISVYQRPNIFNLPYIILLFGGLAYIRDNKSQNL